jgi:hypothetical protein
VKTSGFVWKEADIGQRELRTEVAIENRAEGIDRRDGLIQVIALPGG